MATTDLLKQALRQEVRSTTSSLRQPLSDTQYSAGFDILMQGPGWATYQDFIIPQLSQLLAPLFNSHTQVSVLEIGPGPKSVLGYLPDHLRRKIGRYSAFEPNSSFAGSLREWLTSETEPPLPYLEEPPDIRPTPFILDDTRSGTRIGTNHDNGKYDVVLFCHSMYGMKPKHKFIEKALGMLVGRPEGGIVVVFHRNESLHLDGLVCHRTASYLTGVVRVADDNEVLDRFALFIAGFLPKTTDTDKDIRVHWRKVCRALGRREDAHPGYLVFGSPNVMVAFTQHATALPELTAQVPLGNWNKTVKNREARCHPPASIVRPTDIWDVQQCVRWALKHETSLTIVGGGHSSQCLRRNVVSVDMSAFNQIHILKIEGDGGDFGPLIVAEAGCKTGDIIRKAMASGLTAPMGARPSVGAGLWLQGGIGHLARLHGLACDAIVGAVVVSVDSSQIFYVGHVPSQHRPAGSVRPENGNDLLWAIKGAGTNVGVVISVTFRAYAAPIYLTRNWVVPLSDKAEAYLRLSNFDRLVAAKLPRDRSADAYLYWDAGQVHLGVAMVESFTTGLASTISTPTPAHAILGPEKDVKVVDGVGLFETEMYVSGMHGGHVSGKTSSFKRCLFLKGIGEEKVVDRLMAAIATRPSPLCYIHLLQGGGAVGDIAADATAFGCRDWDFACIITGVWPRNEDGTEVARAAVQWVYDVAGGLLPLSSGAYGADLGPDDRDTALAVKAFGPNWARLGHLKQSVDPHHVLAYACPLSKAPVEPKLVILVTGESGAGKDYCADAWASVFVGCNHSARAVSISDATKREYAAATRADLSRLLLDRIYKEQHRPALTAFFEKQVRQRPQLLEDHFLNAVYRNVDVDVLLITGMREEAPVATFSHLVPNSRLIEVRVQASKQARQIRQGCYSSDDYGDDNKGSDDGRSRLAALYYHPSLIFDNEVDGNEAPNRFAEHSLLPFFHEDVQRLANMVRSVPSFPRRGMEFRHVLNISQHAGGLALCASLMRTHFLGDWTRVDAVVCCEAGGFVYASALASRVDVGVPLVLIREAGKLPPPTISVAKPTSYISSLVPNETKLKLMEMERDVLPRNASVVVVDDVLSTGRTLCAVLQLLGKAGVRPEQASIMAVAEFPIHRGRELLRRHGFGSINIQSLLVFGGI